MIWRQLQSWILIISAKVPQTLLFSSLVFYDCVESWNPLQSGFVTWLPFHAQCVIIPTHHWQVDRRSYWRGWRRGVRQDPGRRGSYSGCRMAIYQQQKNKYQNINTLLFSCVPLAGLSYPLDCMKWSELHKGNTISCDLNTISSTFTLTCWHNYLLPSGALMNRIH